MYRRSLLAHATAGLFATLIPFEASAAAPQHLRLVKDPNCGCCEGHAAYLRENGFTVEIEQSAELDALRAKEGIPAELAGCHMIFAEGYIIEGHVPAPAIQKLLTERPAIKGISLPGMPAGSPGMGGTKEGPLVVVEIGGANPAKAYWTE